MNNLSKYTDKQLKTYRVIILILGAPLIFLSVLLLFVNVFFGLVFLIIGVLEIKVANTYKAELKRREAERSLPVVKNNSKTPAYPSSNSVQDIGSHIPTTSESIIDLDVVKSVLEESTQSKTLESLETQSNIPEHNITARAPIVEHHKIAGTSYRQNEIKSLADENFDYQMSKSDIIDCDMEGVKIYELDFTPSEVKLIEEPDNEYDPKAVKVVIDGVHVGYIKKGSCSHIKNLLKDDKIASISANIFGGKYKVVYLDYDYDKDKDVYNLQKGTTDFFISIDITLK